MARRQVKSVRVSHGFLDNPNNHAIERTINKWMKKGFRLEKQDDQRGGCFRWGYTLLIFIKDS